MNILMSFHELPSILFNTNRNNLDIVAQGKYLPTGKELLQMTITFCVTVFAWIFFRAENMRHAWDYLKSMFSGLLNIPNYTTTAIFIKTEIGIILPLLIAVFMIIEWLGREQQYAIQNWDIKIIKPIRWAIYYILVLIIFYYAGSGKEQEFIYFQF